MPSLIWDVALIAIGLNNEFLVLLRERFWRLKLKTKYKRDFLLPAPDVKKLRKFICKIIC